MPHFAVGAAFITHVVKQHVHFLQPGGCDAKVMGEAVDIPPQDFFDDGERGIPLAQFFDGVYLGACDVVGVVGPKHSVDVVE